jgi:deazaflavin-dependent oxidoreductase (nitroreductase family)
MTLESTNLIPYPKGVLKFLFRLPMTLHRMGLGWMLGPVPLLVLTTRGRKSGLPRPVVLEYRRHGSKLYVISGWGERPHWYKNVQADAEVTVQMGSKERRARATRVENPSEAIQALYKFRRYSLVHERLLASMSSADTIDLRTLTDIADEFTIVRLDLQPGPPVLPGVKAQKRWRAGSLLAIAGVLAWWALRRND